MTEFRYQAFISYSHQDRAWAEWLHQALESCRVPRAFRRQLADHPELSALERLTPVFLDRDELSSSADLSNEVNQALVASRCLLVVCSPAAAKSRWVNEEIRRFQELGRGEKIFCMVVDGEAASHDCFPPAVLDATGDGQADHEPLAADPRPWADGKPLALLKIVSAMLGVRLDYLRQRELHRKHRRWAVAASLFALVALVTSSLAVMFWQERDAAESGRISLQSSLDFHLDELERQQNESTLEVQQSLAEQARALLEALDPDGTNPMYQERRARNARFLGQIAASHRDLEQAGEEYLLSRDLFAQLSEANPADPNLLYELGAAEFYVGSVYRDQGDFQQAMERIRAYLAHAQRLVAMDEQNSDWQAELMYAHSSLGTLQYDLGGKHIEAAISNFDETTKRNELLLERNPGDPYYQRDLAGTLAWRADSYLQQCQLKPAIEDRVRAREILQDLLEAQPLSRDLKQRQAANQLGLANLLYQSGEADRAREIASLAKDSYQALSKADPSNRSLRWRWLNSRAFWARLHPPGSGSEEAKLELASVTSLMREMGQRGESATIETAELGWAYISLGEMLHADGQLRLAESALDQGIELLRQRRVEQADHFKARLELANAQLTRSLLFPDLYPLASIETVDSQEPLSCHQADYLTRLAVFSDKPEKARSIAVYLSERGYRNPQFMNYCKDAGLCPEETT